jgi:hypothetical protein
MTVRRLCKLLLAVLVTAGLSLAPLATASAAGHAMAAPTMQVASDVSGMADDMPCCPHKQTNNDCKDCPLVAICVLKAVQASPSSDGAMIGQVRELLRPSGDVVADGLSRPPPKRPPRYLV